MANPVSLGSFDAWLAPEHPWLILHRKSSNTGTFDEWLTPERPWLVYAEAPTVGNTGTAAIEIPAVTIAATGTYTPQAISGTAGLELVAAAIAAMGEQYPFWLTAVQTDSYIELSWS